jgi:L-2-hydroxyglutarate oxidase LhgO
MEEVECIVVGAGAIGLAVARALAQRGREVIILEASPYIGNEISSRNNEVIHAGFLHPPAMLKGRLGRIGRDALYAYCAERGIPHRRLGKLVIATQESEAAVLARLTVLAERNGVNDLESLDGDAIRRLEPAIKCSAALYSPSTGIVDAHALMLSLLGEAEADGAVLALETRIISGKIAEKGLILRTIDATQAGFDIACRILVNAAGLGARDLAVAFCGTAGIEVPAVNLAKGNFFSLRGAPPFRHLVVPVGETLAAGGAFTLDLAGRGKFGPDLEWVDRIDYTVHAERAQRFGEAIRRYFPELNEDDLQPDYSGLRPRLYGPGEPQTDWLILGPAEHGISGLFHLLGFESPGLTACLAIGDHVADKIH